MATNATTTYAVNGPAIRALRKSQGIAVQELADRVGVKRPYIAKIELGHSRHVSSATLTGLVAALGLEDRRALLANPYGDSAEVAA